MTTTPAPSQHYTVTCETSGGMVTGSTDLPVKRVEHQDDGTITIVLDYWPENTAANQHSELFYAAETAWGAAGNTHNGRADWAERYAGRLLEALRQPPSDAMAKALRHVVELFDEKPITERMFKPSVVQEIRALTQGKPDHE
jgi:hypothetical protein